MNEIERKKSRLEDRISFRNALLDSKNGEEWQYYRPCAKDRFNSDFYSSHFTINGDSISGKELIEKYSTEFPSDREYSTRSNLNRMFSECEIPQFEFSNPEVLKNFLLSAKDPIRWGREGIKSTDEFSNSDFQYNGIKIKGRMLAYHVFIELENKSNNTFYSYSDYLQNPILKKELWKTTSREFYTKLFELSGLEVSRSLSTKDFTPANLKKILLSIMNEDEWRESKVSFSDFQKLQFELKGYEQFNGLKLWNLYSKSKGKEASINDIFKEAQIQYTPREQRKSYTRGKFQERTDSFFENPNYLRKSLLELMTQEEWSKPKQFQKVRSKKINLDGKKISLHTLMTYYSMHNYNAQQEETDNKICFSDEEQILALSSKKNLDEILNIAGIQNRWIPTFEDVNLRDPNFIRRVLLNAEYDGKPISINEIKNMGSKWRKVRVKDSEIGFDKALSSFVMYFTAYDYWKEHPKHSLNYVVQKRKKGKNNKNALREILEFSGL